MSKVTNCPDMPRTVYELQVCVPRPGQTQSGTIKCPRMRSTVLILVEELFHLACVAMQLTFRNPKMLPN